jgi:tRNA pseudouridine38-40 synthase
VTLFDEVPRTDLDPEVALVRVRLVIAYDGSRYHGFAANPGVATVGGTLQRTLERVLRHPVKITGAGRTDRGVHAWGQVVSFDAPADHLDLDDLQRAVNKLCGGTIVVREADVVDASFDARFSARSRLYRYTVLNRPVPDPFLAATSWWVETPLDLRAMQLGCDPLFGEHDFSSFCRRPKGVVIGEDDGGADDGGPSLVRRVIDARWIDAGEGILRFEIEASSFCHQMVRSVFGTLFEMGLGKKRPGEMAAIIRAGDRSVAGQLAPPQGLSLWLVNY